MKKKNYYSNIINIHNIFSDLPKIIVSSRRISVSRSLGREIQSSGLPDIKFIFSSLIYKFPRALPFISDIHHSNANVSFLYVYDILSIYNKYASYKKIASDHIRTIHLPFKHDYHASATFTIVSHGINFGFRL